VHFSSSCCSFFSLRFACTTLSSILPFMREFHIHMKMQINLILVYILIFNLYIFRSQMGRLTSNTGKIHFTLAGYLLLLVLLQHSLFNFTMGTQ
jgi:hypothetical protein